MIAILHNEFVSKKKFFTKDEFLDLIAICESTPGPIAINMATFIGYKNNKIIGSIFATIGVILPAFFIISIIAYFIKDFLEIELVANAFRGIKAGIVVLILFSGFNMFKSLNKRLIWIIVFGLVIVLMVLFELIGFEFSAIYFILIGGLIGYVVSLIDRYKEKINKKEVEN